MDWIAEMNKITRVFKVNFHRINCIFRTQTLIIHSKEGIVFRFVFFYGKSNQKQQSVIFVKYFLSNHLQDTHFGNLATKLESFPRNNENI